jgi:hypothetical protein
MLHPYYVIDFSAAYCMFDIRVNDVSVITMNLEGQAATMIPINHAILQSGQQTISAKILPLQGSTQLEPAAQLKFDIKLFDVSNDFQFKESFASYVSSPVDASVQIPTIQHSDHFTAKVPYTLDAWQNGQELKNNQTMLEQLRSACLNIQTILKNKQYEVFKQKMMAHEKNMATSMYFSKEESAKRLDELIADFQSGFEVMPLPEKVVLHILGNGKLATFKKPNGDSALYLYNKDTKEELMLDINFYLPQGKQQMEII